MTVCGISGLRYTLTCKLFNQRFVFFKGWGDTQGTGKPYILRQTSITIKENSKCGANSDNMLCAGETDPQVHDSCQGDSGGPFVVKKNNNFYLAGIVSWGYDCNGKT